MTITKDQRLQLIGLYTLSLTHNLALKNIVGAMRDIVGEKDEWGHVGDLVWSSEGEEASAAIRTLLKKLEVQVK